MKRPLSAAALALVLATPSYAGDGDAVVAAVERMAADLEAGDVDAVMTAYENGATIMFEPGQPVSDTAAIRQMFGQLAAVDPQVTFTDHEVFVAGDIAVHFAPWSMTGTAPDGTAVRQGGLSVAVFRRQPDGTWRMVIDNPHGSRLLAQ